MELGQLRPGMEYGELPPCGMDDPSDHCVRNSTYPGEQYVRSICHRPQYGQAVLQIPLLFLYCSHVRAVYSDHAASGPPDGMDASGQPVRPDHPVHGTWPGDEPFYRGRVYPFDPRVPGRSCADRRSEYVARILDYRLSPDGAYQRDYRHYDSAVGVERFHASADHPYQSAGFNYPAVAVCVLVTVQY